MSYAIARNEKLTRDNAKGSYVHNERRTKGHKNKDIDSERTYLNYYLKKNVKCYSHQTKNFLIKLEKEKLKDILKKAIILYVIIKI